MNHATREVHIRVDAETHDIGYSAALLRARPGDTIRWLSNQGPFAIQFPGISPVAFGGRRSHDVGGHHQLEGVVRRRAEPGGYRWACALWVGGEVHLDAGCPEIIIDTDGQG